MHKTVIMGWPHTQRGVNWCTISGEIVVTLGLRVSAGSLTLRLLLGGHLTGPGGRCSFQRQFMDARYSAVGIKYNQYDMMQYMYYCYF